MSELASAAARPSRPAHTPPDPPVSATVPEQLRRDHVPTVRLPAPEPVASPPADATVLADRYRLRARVGSDTSAWAEFWRAEDTVLRRDVAITVLRRRTRASGVTDGEDAGAAQAGLMIVRALRFGAFEHPGSARLLDVLTPGAAGLPDDVLGAAVTEWVPGRSLAEALAEGPAKPLVIARAVAPLAAAAEAAHRHGLVLGCDHPQRVRVTPDGRVRLCFALPRPDLRPADDVRGLGAVLYTLLTSRWPLAGADVAGAGLEPADHTNDGRLHAPSALRPGVPVELDALAIGTLGPSTEPGHVHTAAAVHELLTEVVDEADRAVLFPPRDRAPSAPGDVWQDGDHGHGPADPRRRRKLALGLAALGVGVLVVLSYVGVQVSALFSGPSAPAIIVRHPVGPSGSSPGDAPVMTGGVAAVANVEVYDDTGDPDNAGRVSRVIDGNPDSGWRTFVYRQQFPVLKTGVGIMTSFASAVQLSGLTITSPSAGTHIQIRSAPTADAKLADTVPITETTLEAGATFVPLAQSQPVQHVLLWITRLGGGGTENVTEIDEVQFRRTGL